ncbi:MAG: hypothetical protein D6718_10790 [Acidobacteria bacterium]|nr:MAG: hypothetical protein D6718_10790 [Acidobacteriota bacterium]
MAEDGTALDGTPLLVTDVASYKTGPSVTWASGEWAPVWADARDSQIGYTEVYMCRLTSGGEKIDPPGDIRVTCCNDAYHGIYRVPARPAWTGAEYGLVYSEALSGTIDGDLFFQRIDASGDDVGPPLPVTTGGRRSSSDPAIAWNGREFGVAWRDKQAADPAAPYRIYFTRIGCNCTDTDADHYSTCAGNDCDDSDPLVNPGALEDCVNGTDDNCDAAIDCQDQTACPPGPGTTPGEVAGVAFEGQTILSWAAQPSADVYDVLHGTTSELRADGDFGRASCLAWRVAATSLEVPEIPPAGDGTYYLVRAKTDPCLLGTWGDPLRDEARLTCP